MNQVLEAFPKHKKFNLEVLEENAPAIAFYKKHKFKKTGTKVFTIATITLSCFVMEKEV